MTTGSTRARGLTRRTSGGAVLVGASSGSVALGLLLAGAAALVDGRPAAYGALVGSLLGVAVMAFGAFTVHVVAGLLPSASLAVALLTYALQLVVVLAVLVGIERSPAARQNLSEGWLAGCLIGTVLGWVVVQVVLATRARIALYDLPSTSARTGGEP